VKVDAPDSTQTARVQESNISYRSMVGSVATPHASIVLGIQPIAVAPAAHFNSMIECFCIA
jgi:hypothetical protein